MEQRLDNEAAEHRLDHEAAAQQHRHGHSTPLMNNLHHLSTLRMWLAEKRNVILLVATLIATITFQAALNPPGGVWQDDSPQNLQGGSPVANPHKAGDAVMAYNHPGPYATFYIADLIGFITSLSTIFLLMTALALRNNIISGFLIGVLIGVMCLTIISVLVIVAVSIAAITPENVQEEIHLQTAKVVAIIVSCILMISPITALVAICVIIPRANHANGDEEAPQIQVDHANGDQEASQIQVDLNHANGDQKAPKIQVDLNHANGDQEAP